MASDDEAPAFVDPWAEKVEVLECGHNCACVDKCALLTWGVDDPPGEEDDDA